jgi:hypothetical protein
LLPIFSGYDWFTCSGIGQMRAIGVVQLQHSRKWEDEGRKLLPLSQMFPQEARLSEGLQCEGIRVPSCSLG